MKRSYNSSINGWRGIYAIFIFFLHLFGIYLGKSLFETSYLAVEGFFILSGYLLSEKLDNGCELSVYDSISSKVKRLYPQYLLSIALLCCLWIVLPKVRSFYAINGFSLIGELLFLQCSGFFPFQLVNGVSWFISALLISTLFILALYKFLNSKIYVVLPFVTCLSYSAIFLFNGNLDVHGQRCGILLLGVVRACGGISLGMLCFYIAQKDFLREHLKAKNIIEIISAIALVYLLIGRKHSFGDFAILIPISIITICSKYQEGLIHKILAGKGFQYLGKISYEMYLYQAVVIYTMAAYASNLKKSPLIATIIAIIYLLFICQLFSHMSIRITDKIMRGGGIMRSDGLLHKYRDICIVFFAVSFIYVMNGTNVWAEVVAEYMPYANGAAYKPSFAGYITLFPIITAMLWDKVFRYMGISYISFTCIVSYLYTLLCFFATLKVLQKRNENKFMVFLPILAVLCHPSVQSIINITHLGYLPLIIHIVCCAKHNNMSSEICDIQNAGGGV